MESKKEWGEKCPGDERPKKYIYRIYDMKWGAHTLATFSPFVFTFRLLVFRFLWILDLQREKPTPFIPNTGSQYYIRSDGFAKKIAQNVAQPIIFVKTNAWKEVALIYVLLFL
jgi:hypothetical protein